MRFPVRRGGSLEGLNGLASVGLRPLVSKMQEGRLLKTVKGVFGRRWFSGLALALVVLGSFTAAGVILTGSSSAGSIPAGIPLSIRLTIPGVTGQSGDKQDWVELDSFSWGATQSGTFSTPGELKVNEFSIAKPLDKSSPKLFEYCVKGEHFPEAMIEMRKASGASVVYLKYELRNVIVSSYSIGANSVQDPIPTESISFTFQTINVEYVEQGFAIGLLCGTSPLMWNICTRAGAAP